MAKFIIQGGRRLQGSIAVAGAKNHALKLFAAAVLTDQPVSLRNVPEIEDIFRLQEILAHLGVQVHHLAHGRYNIDASHIQTTILPRQLVPKLRASILLAGPLLARFGTVQLPHPGGCAIGKRPINLFIDAFTAMGARHTYQRGIHTFTAKRGLRGAHYVFPVISVTGTETMVLAAVLAKGETVIENAAREPEVAALCQFLKRCGARISGEGTSTIRIEGVKRLHGGATTVIPDRIETLSFMFLALAAKQQLTIRQCEPRHVTVPLQLLKDAGAKFRVTDSSITVLPWKRLRPLEVVTREYPGFPTDAQPALTVFLTQIAGHSEVMETIYADRLFYSDMLNRMGAKITIHTSQHITIEGSTRLKGKEVDSPDLRAGIAMVIAGAIARGHTVIGNIYQIDRGYEAIDQRLRRIGIDITRQN
ncbi:MAG: hypothetical protein ACD_41C00345G0003 [uncultured bacterium]|nr:MAG: hypothetical protein ACD_41C00345G0003 [uncultured bacterium]HBY73867.1 UDP-N-acetylglucosamine 1-carboxyvinyltransferase [Candidatus Kerfeldbacteria bacterium]